MRILVTGSAGFIGFNLVKYLLKRGDEVVGIDNINDYYDIDLKLGRLADTGVNGTLNYGEPKYSDIYPNYCFIKLDLTDLDGMKRLFGTARFDAVCNLAAQAGVRYSLINPQAYIDSNIQGFMNVLQCCKDSEAGHLIYASSSSVYGLNTNMPFSVNSNVDHPISIYAVTKKSNELMAHSYSHLFQLPTTGLRFFTVYGPWGRPDMALFLFTKAILEGRGIQIYNDGNMKRDFTYVDDIVMGIVGVINNPASPNLQWNGNQPDPATALSPYRIYNVGGGNPISLLDFVQEIEKSTGLTAKKEYLPLQAGDLTQTWAEIDALNKLSGYMPTVSLADGVKNFVDWYRVFYNSNLEVSGSRNGAGVLM
ncbi:NAD-dependent epimerase [Pedobacter psychroterrae]|uniref:NAD-dependent epimerase n=1 Tax=Pedobacter psychroterrae TaxID=2530453 RepID=A0A4R0N9H8_9SPHI|nr:NAD-dependent epimerase [Pedobacter psychroterrae]TCC96810.1 NAD-dependent epimerase [Pedobacter psychroterrae]